MSWRERLRYRLGQVRTRTVAVQGVPIAVPPGVLDPVLFRTGAWFATQVRDRVSPGQTLLDLGCGSGVVGALAARAGARVVATDMSPAAVAAARANGLADVRQGDLFEPVTDARFDLVCFNPPFFPEAPGEGPLDGALYGGADLGVVRRFTDQVGGHLHAGGAAWVCWSSLAPPAGPVLGAGWRCEVRADVGGARRPETLELWLRQADRGPA